MPLFQQVAATLPLLLAAYGCWVLAAPRRPGRPAVAGALLLVASALLWSRVQKAYEGPTVVRVLPGHGLTVADLVVVPCLGIGVAVLLRARRQRP